MLRTPSTWFFILHKRVYHPILTLNNANIERVSQFNFFGVVLASTLNWDTHIGHVSLKIPRVIGILFRLKHICPQELVLLHVTLCNTLILPHLSYCIMVWGSKIQTYNRLHLLKKNSHNYDK